MVDIQKNVSLQSYNTFHTKNIARYFAIVETPRDIPELIAVAHKKNIPLHILGGGSNTIFTKDPIEQLVLHMKESYIHICTTEDTTVDIEIGAGTKWDEVVQWAIQNNISGTEALSGIPGTAGAAPIQNIGAYGQEIRDVLIEVHAYDIAHHAQVILPISICHMTYRSSIFKEERGRYIVTAIVLRLKKELPHIPAYPDVQDYFKKQFISNPTLSQIREAILFIRSQKLPDPDILPNVGSFFKNPIITQTQAKELQKNYPFIKLFPINATQVKIPAGWLIEQCGLKGTTIGPVGIYEKNALILTNTGGATYHDIMFAKNSITQKVFEKFKISLEMEPDCI